MVAEVHKQFEMYWMEIVSKEINAIPNLTLMKPR